MSLLGRLFMPLDAMNEFTISGVLYIIFTIVLMGLVIGATIALDFQPWGIRLFILSLIYYTWFNYINHYKLHKETK